VGMARLAAASWVAFDFLLGGDLKLRKLGDPKDCSISRRPRRHDAAHDNTADSRCSGESAIKRSVTRSRRFHRIARAPLRFDAPSGFDSCLTGALTTEGVFARGPRA
jgi:hypothetical protein